MMSSTVYHQGEACPVCNRPVDAWEYLAHPRPGMTGGEGAIAILRPCGHAVNRVTRPVGVCPILPPRCHANTGTVT